MSNVSYLPTAAVSSVSIFLALLTFSFALGICHGFVTRNKCKFIKRSEECNSQRSAMKPGKYFLGFVQLLQKPLVLRKEICCWSF